MISIKTLLLYVAGILVIAGVTAVVTIKITNNTYQTQSTKQEKKEAESHEAWRRMMSDGPTNTPPLGAALKDPDTILNDFHVTSGNEGGKNEKR